jgi:hypothetical protein
MYAADEVYDTAELEGHDAHIDEPDEDCDDCQEVVAEMWAGMVGQY